VIAGGINVFPKLQALCAQAFGPAPAGIA